MLTRIAAQGLTDALSAAALAAYTIAALRRRSHSPLEQRLLFVFAGLSLVFAFRSMAEILAHPMMGWVSEVLVSVMPIAGLCLAEGLVRRHAPWGLKTAITLGAAILCVGLILSGGRPPVSTWALGAYVVLSLVALTTILLTRNRASLSHQENAAVVGFMLAAAALLVLSITDFTPAAPLGMSGVGAAALAFIASERPTSTSAVRTSLARLLAIAVFGAVFALGVARALAIGPVAEVVRLGGVVITLIIAVTTMLKALQERAIHDDAKDLRRALVDADTSSLTAFLGGLVEQPLFKGLRLAEGELLADYDAPSLLETLLARPVWTRHDLNGVQTSGSNRGREELADLMARTDASHAVLVSRQPMRVALLILPELGSVQDVDTDLALFRKLATIAAGEHA